MAEERPLYSGETTETAWHILKDFLMPLVFRKKISGPEEFHRAAVGLPGQPDGQGRAWSWPSGTSRPRRPALPLSQALRRNPDGNRSGRQRAASRIRFPTLVDRVGSYLERGLSPDQDQDQARLGCRRLRGRCATAIPDILLQVDANGAYALRDADALVALDEFRLLLIEQPFAPYDLWDHAALQKKMKTPLCLDESILSLDTARAALEMGSCRIINIKVGRVGGPVEAAGHP